MSLITADNLIWASSEELLGTLLFPGAFLGQGAPVAGQVPQLALRPRRDEAGPQHAALGELGQPDRVQLVGLGTAGDALDIAGVDHLAGSSSSAGVVVAKVRTSWRPAPGLRSCGTRTQAVSDAFPMSSAATRSTSAPGSSVISAMKWPLPRASGSRRAARGSQEGVQRRNRVLKATMQDPCGRLPAPDSYTGSTAPSITGFSGHPTRFSPSQGVARDTDDSCEREQLPRGSRRHPGHQPGRTRTRTQPGIDPPPPALAAGGIALPLASLAAEKMRRWPATAHPAAAGQRTDRQQRLGGRLLEAGSKQRRIHCQRLHSRDTPLIGHERTSAGERMNAQTGQLCAGSERVGRTPTAVPNDGSVRVIFRPLISLDVMRGAPPPLRIIASFCARGSRAAPAGSAATPPGTRPAAGGPARRIQGWRLPRSGTDRGSGLRPGGPVTREAVPARGQAVPRSARRRVPADRGKRLGAVGR